jgi:hypothetical protein
MKYPYGFFHPAPLFAAGVLVALAAVSCISRPSPPSGYKPEPETPSVAENPPYSVQPPRSLPPEARTYLAAVAEAFSSGDRAFLIAQGENQFEEQIRPAYDEEIYLALLYRIGSLSVDNPSALSGAGNAFPRLSPPRIRRIEFAGWEEVGPVFIVTARLITKTNETIPCTLVVLWRLREPKILGVYP